MVSDEKGVKVCAIPLLITTFILCNYLIGYALLEHFLLPISCPPLPHTFVLTLILILIENLPLF